MPILDVFNLFNPEEVNLVTSNTQDASRGILTYGESNDIPQQLINSIDGSHSGTSCITTLIDFIIANGFSEEQAGDLLMNTKGHTLKDLHMEAGSDVGTFYGVAFVVKYNNKYEKIGVFVAPFEQVRIGRLDERGKVKDYVHNPYFGTEDGGKTEFDTRYFPFDDDPKVIKEQVKEAGIDKDSKKSQFNGQMLYKIVPRPGKRYYPLPPYASGIDWFEVENKIGRFHNTNISNNFMLSSVMTILGDPEKGVEFSEDKDGNQTVTKTASEALNETMSEVFSGNDNGGKMMVLWVTSQDEKPNIEAFPNNTNDKLFDTLQQLTTDNIAIATNVPPVLANIQTAGKLGNTQEILNAVDLMQKRVVKLQQLLEGCYRVLTRNLVVEGQKIVTTNENGEEVSFAINKFNPVSSIKDQIWDVLTESEKRTFASENIDLELEIIEDQDQNINQSKEAEARANLRGSVGGVTALIDMVAKVKIGEIDKESAISILQITYGYSEEEASKIFQTSTEGVEVGG